MARLRSQTIQSIMAGLEHVEAVIGRSPVHCEVIQALEAAGTVNIFVICLDKADSAHNVIDKEFGLGMGRALYLAREKASKGELDVVVLCSAKKRSFLAGADILHELKFVGVEGSRRAFADVRGFQDFLCALESLPVPTIAVLNGATLGGGLEVALACDYRIADSKHCTQIGLPEVKLGYLPGAGGCCRLPRLIGFRKSLDLILTGRAITAQKALTLGIVDHLMVVTDTTVQEDSHGHRSYDYKWFSSVLACIEGGKLGNEAFDFSERIGLSAVDACLNEERLSSLTEDQLLGELSKTRDAWEKKAAQKYPTAGKTRWSIVLGYFANLVFYIVALYQLWKSVAVRMPAPYAALQTTFRCLYTTSWLEAMQLNAIGFVSLATTAEAKSLSSIFLLTRKLKRFALTFGLQSDTKEPPVQQRFDKASTTVLVTVSKEGLRFSSAFIQSLLYAGLEVYASSSGEGIRAQTITELVRKHFDYSLKRGHMKPGDVEEKLAKLHFFNRSSDLAEGLGRQEGKRCLVVINSVFSGETEALIDSLELTYPKVIYLDLCPCSQPSTDDCVVLVCLGDPLRKNSLCVELSPANANVPPEDIRIAAALVDALGKIPVVTPSSPLLSMAHYLAVHQWSLAASLMARGGLTPTQIDASLTAAGFSKGPFATMKELDKAYVSQIVELGSHGGIDCTAVRAYLNGTLKVRYRRGKAPPPTEITDLFMAGAVNAALLIKKLSPSVPEAAIDILAVSGLAHFPPTEGGPLSYITRVGADKVVLRLKELAYTPAIGSEAEAILRSSKLLEETQRELFLDETKADVVKDPKVEREQGAEFKRWRSEFIALSAEELRIVGPTRGVTNQELFLFPLPAMAALVSLLLLALTVALVLVYLVLSLF